MINSEKKKEDKTNVGREGRLAGREKHTCIIPLGKLGTATCLMSYS